MQANFIKLLTWSEKYIKTDMSYLGNGGFWSILSYLIQIGIGIISTVALANYLPKESLGTYQFILAAAGILGVLTLTGLGASITRSVAQGKDGVLRSGVITKLKWGSGVTMASLLLSSYYAFNGNTDLAIAFIIVGVCTAITESFVLYESFLQGKKAFRDSVLLGAWRKPLPLIALLITLYFTTHVPTLVGVYLGTTTLSTILVYLTVIKKYQPPVDHDAETLSFGKQLSIMNVMRQAAAHADKVLLWYMLGPVAVATFSIAQLATRYSGGIVTAVSHIALPKLATRDLPTLQATLSHKIGLFTLVTIPLMVAYIAIIPLLFRFLFPEYSDSIPLAQILGLLFLFLPFSIYTNALTAHRQTKSLYIQSIFLPVISILVMVMLIHHYGVFGATYALIVNGAIGSALSWYQFSTARG
jgi:O-antigen/teichoic acid export membrane protein